MNASSAGDPNYLPGRSEGETSRLQRQAELFEQPTRRLFEDAGITTGMKVLDLGSGAGDVAFIAAELVGPTGRVVGVDMNPAVVATASAGARAVNLTQVSFIAGDIRETELECDFDAVVGRFVLVYLPDPVAGLLAALRMVRDDGRAAAYEANLGSKVASFPESPLHQLLGRCLNESFARGGVELQMGTKLYQVFLAAGLETPHLRSEALMGGGPDWLKRLTAAYGANILRTLLPAMLRYGVATEEELGIETFDQRYQEEVLRHGSVLQWETCMGAWARKRRLV
jgi:SAM-dependent methyltransferase